MDTKKGARHSSLSEAEEKAKEKAFESGRCAFKDLVIEIIR
ncbi:hypothetical protein [Komagataeibacter medellinensis]|nr:hypothetical protein [Komagataeibacter medellinensis]